MIPAYRLEDLDDDPVNFYKPRLPLRVEEKYPGGDRREVVITISRSMEGSDSGCGGSSKSGGVGGEDNGAGGKKVRWEGEVEVGAGVEGSIGGNGKGKKRGKLKGKKKGKGKR